MEEGRGRMYKEGDRMVEGGMILERIFAEEGRKEGARTEGKKIGGGALLHFDPKSDGKIQRRMDFSF